jgi:large conductance mechanosensitive channel
VAILRDIQAASGGKEAASYPSALPSFYRAPGARLTAAPTRCRPPPAAPRLPALRVFATLHGPACPFVQRGPNNQSGEENMSFVSEFKEFALKGNVVDLAVGVIIGGAFGKIVDSMVADVIMPVIGAIVGKVDFSNLFIVLGSVPEGTVRTLDALKKAGVPVLAYGNFITIALNFLILAFVIFIMIKQINRLKREPAPAPAEAPATPEDVVLLREIRDALKK